MTFIRITDHPQALATMDTVHVRGVIVNAVGATGSRKQLHVQFMNGSAILASIVLHGNHYIDGKDMAFSFGNSSTPWDVKSLSGFIAEVKARHDCKFSFGAEYPSVSYMCGGKLCITWSRDDVTLNAFYKCADQVGKEFDDLLDAVCAYMYQTRDFSIIELHKKLKSAT